MVQKSQISQFGYINFCKEMGHLGLVNEKESMEMRLMVADGNQEVKQLIDDFLVEKLCCPVLLTELRKLFNQAFRLKKMSLDMRSKSSNNNSANKNEKDFSEFSSAEKHEK